ncbi:ATP-binding cassette domain-containing protein OS=Streptomyces alboniger OX=132473 GN=CP975_21605 PE=3 SV=1 [Streptomyces alboniger]
MALTVPTRKPPTDESATPVFSVEGLWKVFGPKADSVPADPELAALAPTELRSRTGCTAAVRDVSFDVRKGEVFVVMGLSGSGKSTLVRCLTRLIEPTAGTIAIDGEDVRAMDRSRRPRAAPPPGRDGLPALRPAPAPHGPRQRGLRPGDPGRRPGRAPGPRPGHRRQGRPGGHGQRVRASCPAVSSSAWDWPARSPSTPRSCCSTPFSALDPLIRRDMQEEVVRLHREEGRTMVFIAMACSTSARRCRSSCT